MTDPFSPDQRSWIMRQVHNKNTRPELLVRRLIHASGYRFRIHRKDLPGSPDIVFPGRHCVIFVNGCFWHGHACKRARLPETHREYWQNKIQKTLERDRKHREDLATLGWSVLTIWECQLKDMEDVKQRIRAFLG